MYKRIHVTAKYKRLAVWKKTRGRCYYCKQRLPYELMTIEHLKQVYIGGTNEISNLVPSCRSCNSARGSMTPSQMQKYAKNKMKKEKHKKITQKEKKMLKTAFQKIGREGGLKTLENYGSEHFRKIANIAWKKRRAAKKAEESKK